MRRARSFQMRSAMAVGLIAIVLAWVVMIFRPAMAHTGSNLDIHATTPGSIFREPTITLLRSGPDSLCAVGHFKDSLRLYPAVGSTWRPSCQAKYYITWDSLTGRVDSICFGILIRGYSSAGTYMGSLTDSTITAQTPDSRRIPLGDQISADHYTITLLPITGSCGGADSTSQYIFHHWYIQQLIPVW